LEGNRREYGDGESSRVKFFYVMEKGKWGILRGKAELSYKGKGFT
jgi:hypothetical protein